jgi:hypothetical protein
VKLLPKVLSGDTHFKSRLECQVICLSVPRYLQAN